MSITKRFAIQEGQIYTYNAINQVAEAAVALSPAEQGPIWLPDECRDLVPFELQLHS
jgi:hypothetical protein